MKAIICILLLPVTLRAQGDLSAGVDRYMQASVAVNRFNGNVLLASGERVHYQSSELFVAAAVLLLRDRGKLQVTDAVTRYLPELPYGEPTIHHLLTHTSGLPDFFEVMKDERKGETLASNEDMVTRLAQARRPLLCRPGTQ